jgi:transcription elongation factor Elf1
MAIPDRFNCPKCGQELERSGRLEVDGEPCSVFQCDSCQVTVDMFGETELVAFTFAVNENGRAFDPAAPDGELPR